MSVDTGLIYKGTDGPGWYTRPKTVTHTGSNRARRALTSFMRRTPLTIMPRRQPTRVSTAVAPPGFCNRGEVRYGSIGGPRVRSPPVPVVLSVYQRGSLLDGLAMYLSCDTKKFHDDESTHILHNFWTSTNRGKLPPWRHHWSTASTLLYDVTHKATVTLQQWTAVTSDATRSRNSSAQRCYSYIEY